MLHAISHSPDVIRALRRIGAFQQLLFTRLCAPATRAGHIDVAWVRNVWFRLPQNWVESFCTFRPPGPNKTTALESMRKIADTSNANKRRIFDSFVSGQRVDQWFLVNGSSLTAKDATTSEQFRKAVVNLLHVFYAPALYLDRNYNGYPEPIGDAIESFRHQRLMELFDIQNNLEVCPYCNGTFTHRDVDHYVPLSRHPWLSCSPLNLVPACKGCNQAKTTRPPWTDNVPVPTADWFHPLLRSADGNYNIELRGVAGRPEPRMVPAAATPANRCSNFENLVKLPETWKTQARSVVSTLKIQLRVQARKRGAALNELEVRSILADYRDEANEVVRSAPFSLVRRAVCEATLNDRAGYMQMFIDAAVP